MPSLLGLLIFVFDVIAIVDIAKSSMNTTNKIIWVIVVCVLPVIGMILYFAFGKNGKLKV